MSELTVRFNNVPFFRKLVNVLNELVPRADWEFKMATASVYGDRYVEIEYPDMDRSYIIHLRMKFDTNTDIEFHRGFAIVSMNIDTSSLLKILDCATKEDELTLTKRLDENVAAFTFENRISINSIDLPLNDLLRESAPLHEPTYQLKITMPSKRLYDAIKSFPRNIGGVSFIADAGQFIMKSDNHEVVMTNDEKGIKIETSGPIKTTVEWSFLFSMAKAHELSKQVEIFFHQSQEPDLFALLKASFLIDDKPTDIERKRSWLGVSGSLIYYAGL